MRQQAGVCAPVLRVGDPGSVNGVVFWNGCPGWVSGVGVRHGCPDKRMGVWISDLTT